jgi:ABC-type transport system involved in cytochrome bd biosynthesis fused ATPase/permease subunit
LDDIISAVDVTVAEFLIKETILTYLKGKTILLATHAANFAEYADEIVILHKGVIVRKGNFRDIRDTEEFKQVY